MNIQEAVKRASEIDGYIVCDNWPFVAIKPTDTPDGCMGYSTMRRDKAPYKRWQPNAGDLVSDKWRVIKAIDELL